MTTHYTGKSVFVTGANGGLGKETVKILIQDGFTRIVMAGRNTEKVEAARAEVIAATTPGPEVEITAVGGFDMNDPSAIARAVNALPDQPFDVVFLQAGGVVFTNDYDHVSWNGVRVEKTVFQNVIGGHVTLAALEKRGLVADRARIVVAGGEGARGIPGLIARPSFSDGEDLRAYLLGAPAESTSRAYNPMNAIGVSKLMSALWTRKMAELKPDAEVVWFSPGLTYGTDGLADQPPVKRWFLEKVVFGLMGLLGKAQSPTAGAHKYVDALEGKIGRSGDVIGAPEGKALGALVDQTPMNPAFTNPDLREAFWGVVQEVAGPYPA